MAGVKGGRVQRAFVRALLKSLPKEDKRTLEAWLLVSSGHVRVLGFSEAHCLAEVASATTGEMIYKVEYHPTPGEWTCSCADFQYRGGRQGFKCKHIRAASWVWGSVREGVQTNVE